MLGGVWRSFDFICSVKQTLCFALCRESDCAGQVVLVSTLNLVYSVMCPLRNSACILAIVNSPQSNQANGGTVSPLDHKRLITDSFAVISHLIIRSCIVSILRTSLNNQQKICEAFLPRLFKKCNFKGLKSDVSGASIQSFKDMAEYCGAVVNF
jgi:hypothetical protein